mmetsp:Transcript_14449/g.10418  ORF Transcript_14449/g.10418 Transcript_14449/m.10418 type:complete len:85 (-) Transcript_14449:23-277(-)
MMSTYSSIAVTTTSCLTCNTHAYNANESSTFMNTTVEVEWNNSLELQLQGFVYEDTVCLSVEDFCSEDQLFLGVTNITEGSLVW